MATDKRNYNYQNSTLNRDRKLEIIMRHQKKKKKNTKRKTTVTFLLQLGIFMAGYYCKWKAFVMLSRIFWCYG